MTNEGASGSVESPALGAAQPLARNQAFPLWLALASVSALVSLLYLPTWAELWRCWLDDPTYSHGFLIPLISGWLAWRWFRLDCGEAQPQIGLGAAEIAAGVLVHLAALVVVSPLLDFAGLGLILRGVALAIGGRHWARGLAYPMLFLFFMFPLPGWLTSALAVWLQGIVAKLSAGVLDQFWVCQQRGHALVIAGLGLDRPLLVGEECSGLRQLLAFIALAALIGYLWLRPLSLRALLVLTAVPVAIVANVLRVVLMACGAKWFGMSWLECSWLHDAPALVTFPVGLGSLGLLAWLLSHLQRKTYGVKAGASPDGPRVARRPVGIVAGCLMLGLGVQSALQLHLAAGTPAERLQLLRHLGDFPTELGGWQGMDHPDAAQLLARVQFADELLLRTYQQPGKATWAHVYLVYSKHGKDREHHPEICIRDVAGLPEDLKWRGLVFLDAQGRRPVQRFRFRAGGDQYFFVYYWHCTLASTVSEETTFLQAVHERLGRRPASLTVQVTTPMPPEELNQLEAGLLRNIDLALQDHMLPAGARMGCDRLPIRFIGDD